MIKKVVKWKKITMAMTISCLVISACKSQFFGHEPDTIYMVLVSVGLACLITAAILQAIIDAQKIEDLKEA